MSTIETTISPQFWIESPSAALDMAWTDSADNPVFDAFYAGYDRAFVLPDEKEDADGFADCLALNRAPHKARLEALHGKYHEYCLVTRDEHGMAGGANFIAFEADENTITANLNYCYVDSQARGRGHLRRLLGAMADLISSQFGQRERLLIFLEQNDPLAMGEEEYARDSEFTGLDQIDRLRVWARLGARIVDFPYVQPPLSPAHQADTGLTFAVIGSTEAALSACLLGDHLRRFFAISVLKGAPLEEDAHASTQVAALAAKCRAQECLALLDPGPVLAKVTSREQMVALAAGGDATLRAVLRERA